MKTHSCVSSSFPFETRYSDEWISRFLDLFSFASSRSFGKLTLVRPCVPFSSYRSISTMTLMKSVSSTYLFGKTQYNYYFQTEALNASVKTTYWVHNINNRGKKRHNNHTVTSCVFTRKGSGWCTPLLQRDRLCCHWMFLSISVEKKWFELKEAVSWFCNIKQEDKVMEGLLLNNEVKATQWLGNKQVSVYRFAYIFYQDWSMVHCCHVITKLTAIFKSLCHRL